MSYVLNTEKQIDVWIRNIEAQLEAEDVEGALAFLHGLKETWEEYKRGEQTEPVTIYTGANV